MNYHQRRRGGGPEHSQKSGPILFLFLFHNLFLFSLTLRAVRRRGPRPPRRRTRPRGAPPSSDPSSTPDQYRTPSPPSLPLPRGLRLARRTAPPTGQGAIRPPAIPSRSARRIANPAEITDRASALLRDPPVPCYVNVAGHAWPQVSSRRGFRNIPPTVFVRECIAPVNPHPICTTDSFHCFLNPHGFSNRISPLRCKGVRSVAPALPTIPLPGPSPLLVARSHP